jgi:hypothetical protein
MATASKPTETKPLATKIAEKFVPPLRDVRRPPKRPQSHGLGIDPELFKKVMPNFVLNLPDYYPPPPKGTKPGQPPVVVHPVVPGPLPPGPPGPPTHPSSFDWRSSPGRNCITAIRDQEQCGSCVAFGTTALLEAMVRIERDMWVDLSEADLFEGGGSCQNGWEANSAISRVMQDGVPLERELPYPPGASATTVINQLPGGGSIALAIKAANNTVFYNRDSRKNYLSTTGPMIACMDVYKDFEDWGGGTVYHYDGTSMYMGGHCLLVIGYDDNAGCWIVKNSWGNWADGGFARIGYGECGIDGDSPFLAWNFGSPFWGLTNVELPDDYRFEIWADRFRGGSLDDVAVYDAAMDLLYMGSNGGANFQWSPGMSVSGEPTLRRPKMFSGSFTGSWESTLLVYDAVTKNWNSGHFAPIGPATWTTVGNTTGFGDVADGRPFWRGYFSALDREQVLFYYPGDGNWWVGTLNNNQLTWQNAGNTAGYGNMADGRPLLMSDFDGTARHVFLFYYPAQGNWWLGTMASGTFAWKVVAPSPTFAPLPGARFFSGYFRGVFQADLLVYTPYDLTWRLGSLATGKLVWTVAGNSAQFGNLADGRALVGGRFTASAAGILFQMPDSSWRLGTLDSNGQLQWSNLGAGAAGASPAVLRSPVQVTGTFTQSWQDALLVQDQDLGAWWLGTIGTGTIAWQNLGGQPFMRS